MSLFVFLLSLGSVLRLTRLLVQDVITEPIRDFLRRNNRVESRGSRIATFLTKLLDCPWCTGFWVSVVAALVDWNVTQFTSPAWFAVPALALTLSYLTGFIYSAVFTLELYEPPGSPGRHDH